MTLLKLTFYVKHPFNEIFKSAWCKSSFSALPIPQVIMTGFAKFNHL